MILKSWSHLRCDHHPNPSFCYKSAFCLSTQFDPDKMSPKRLMCDDSVFEATDIAVR